MMDGGPSAEPSVCYRLEGPRLSHDRRQCPWLGLPGLRGPSLPPQDTCVRCGAPAQRRCSGCRPKGLRPALNPPLVQSYCSIECQRHIWRDEHRHSCVRRDLGPRHLRSNHLVNVGSGPWLKEHSPVQLQSQLQPEPEPQPPQWEPDGGIGDIDEDDMKMYLALIHNDAGGEMSD